MEASSGRAAATPCPRAVIVIRVPPLHGQSTGDREGVVAMYLMSNSTVMPADTMVPCMEEGVEEGGGMKVTDASPLCAR